MRMNQRETTTPLRDSVRRHVESVSLSDDQWASLESMVAGTQPEPAKHAYIGWVRGVALAAALTLGIGVGFWVVSFLAPTKTPPKPKP